MDNFTRRIGIRGNYLYEFFFNQIYTANGVHYHVSVTDETGQRHSFNMIKRNEAWRIVNAPQVVAWIMELEEELAKAILKA